MSRGSRQDKGGQVTCVWCKGRLAEGRLKVSEQFWWREERRESRKSVGWVEVVQTRGDELKADGRDVREGR